MNNFTANLRKVVGSQGRLETLDQWWRTYARVQKVALIALSVGTRTVAQYRVRYQKGKGTQGQAAPKVGTAT